MAPDQIRTQLDHILGSTVFEQADRAKAFLGFIVTAALNGRSEQIKEMVIAVEVLARSTSFDPKTDPIVRVEAGRLRSRLKTYYDSEGLRDRILITLPKGSYVPEFSEREIPEKIAVRPDTHQNRSILWIRSLDSPEPRVIPGTEAATQVFWSPDSRSLGFFRTDRLLRVEVAGGPAQEICPVTISMGGGSWSRDGVIVFSPRPEGVLYKVPATGGVPQPATALDRSHGESVHRSPEFLPDGKHFLYVANSANSGATTLRVGSIDSMDSRILLEPGGNAVYAPPLPGRAGSLLFYFQGVLMA